MNEKVTLTEEQVEHWRKVLFGVIGVYALIMPAEKIQMFHELLTVEIDALTGELVPWQGGDETADKQEGKS